MEGQMPIAKFKAIGAEIKEARRRMGWSQEELGARLQISATHVSELEKGRKKPSKIVFGFLWNIFEDTALDILSKEDMKKGRKFLEE